MWIRSAFFEGTLDQDNADAFRTAIEQDVAPAIARLDGVRGVETLWPRAIEDRPEKMLCQLLVRFDRQEDIARMLGSVGRNEVRARVADMVKRTDVRISHINYEVA